MDSLIAAAARALVVGDALGALKRVGLRDDPPALALRGIAMAQLGEHPRARELLRREIRGERAAGLRPAGPIGGDDQAAGHDSNEELFCHGVFLAQSGLVCHNFGEERRARLRGHWQA